MNEAVVMWLFGIVGAWLGLLSATMLKLLIEHVKTKVAVDLFIDTLGEKLAKALHADDDHLALDSLLDKYLDRSYELSYGEWMALKVRCDEVLSNDAVSKLERSLAGMLSAVCEHKLKCSYNRPNLSAPNQLKA